MYMHVCLCNRMVYHKCIALCTRVCVCVCVCVHMHLIVFMYARVCVELQALVMTFCLLPWRKVLGVCCGVCVCVCV